MSNIVVLYHDNCPDGITAAWAAWRIYPDAEFIPVNHSQSFPEGLEDKDIFLLDFCYPREQLLELKELSSTLCVVDHHVSAKEDCEGLAFCHFDMTKSGAGLAWEFFHPEAEIPPLVCAVEWRDLGGPWRGVKPPFEDAEAFLAAIDSYEKSFEQWNEFYYKWSGGVHRHNEENMRNALLPLINEGKAILRYKQQLVDGIYKNAHEMDFQGHKIKVVNSPIFQSELGNKLAHEGEFGAVWFRGSDHNKFSLRSADKEDLEAFNVSKVCSSFEGGGGHHRAGGFNRKALKVEDLLDD